MSSKLLDGLNDEQLAAVTSTAQVILCLAGAGSGKTKTLVSRVAYLNSEKRVGTSNILCLTFTRLAGKEMKQRACKLLGEDQGKSLFCNTFHAFAANVLQNHGSKIGIEPNFTIYDQDDRKEVLIKICAIYGGKAALNYIEKHPESHEAITVMKEYEYRLRQNNAVDLDKLVVKVCELFSCHPDVLASYQNQFTHVFVDEFQDTSNDQAEMVRLLNPQALFIVGDDFQAIYGWRGAEVGHIIALAEKPDIEVVKLERNYRSTVQIVTAANSLISKNVKQTKKVLLASKSGVEIDKQAFENRWLEAEYIAEQIKLKDCSWKDIVVLARTNQHVDFVMDLCKEKGIPCQRISGSDDPFKMIASRAIIDWMFFLQNKQDDVALQKIIRDYTLSLVAGSKIMLHASRTGKSLWDAMQDMPEAVEFVEDVYHFEEEIAAREAYTPVALFKVLDDLLEISKRYDEQGLDRRKEDLGVTAEAIFIWQRSRLDMNENAGVRAFLRWIRYRDMQEKLFDDKDAVKFMTVHASKGLEFDTVFVAGLTQGVFPSKRTDNMEEERRLFYVAITRAKNKLFLTSTTSVPDWRGSPVPAQQSQFISESTG